MIDDAHRRFSVWGGRRAAKAETLAKPGGDFATFSEGEREGIIGLFYSIVHYGWVYSAVTGFLRVMLVVSGQRWCGGFLVVVGWCSLYGFSAKP